VSPEERNEVVGDLLPSGHLSLAGRLYRKQLREKTKDGYIRE
jgi:hypothetical protein